MIQAGFSAAEAAADWSGKRESGELQLARLLDFDKPIRVLGEVRRLFCLSFPSRAFAPVKEAFRLVLELFSGHYPGYAACSTGYHDYRHTIQVFAAGAHLLDGRAISGPAPGPGTAADLLIAALLHDSGYILEADDRSGTGAKYTKMHVDRSADFVVSQARVFHLDADRADRVARLILGTDLARRWQDLAFAADDEADAAAILAAADILGQMGDRIYLEKLLFLYYEFREAGVAGYDTAYDMLVKTLGFYEAVRSRLDTTLASTADLARTHFLRRNGVDRDLYREAIQRQMDYLARIIADDTVNFRRKLKRMDLEAAELRHAEMTRA
jgi:hypothetical protein